jgi:hypothetical protein
VAGPTTITHPLREGCHPPKDIPHVARDITPINGKRVTRASTQGNVENSTILSAVDPLAAKHPLNPPAKIDLIGEFDEEPKRLGVKQLLRIIEKQARRLGRQTLTAARIGRKKPPQGMGR